jgi:hypothetical protein
MDTELNPCPSCETPDKPALVELTGPVIQATYQGLVHTRVMLFSVAEKAIEARRDLQATKLHALADGLIVGKNEAEREAKAMELWPDLYGELEDTEAAERQARCEFDCAQADVEMVRALLRLAELEAKLA